MSQRIQSQTAPESSSEIQSTDEEADMQELGSEQQLQSAETEPAYPRMDKLLQNREHEGIM